MLVAITAAGARVVATPTISLATVAIITVVMIVVAITASIAIIVVVAIVAIVADVAVVAVVAIPIDFRLGPAIELVVAPGAYNVAAVSENESSRTIALTIDPPPGEGIPRGIGQCTRACAGTPEPFTVVYRSIGVLHSACAVVEVKVKKALVRVPVAVVGDPASVAHVVGKLASVPHAAERERDLARAAPHTFDETAREAHPAAVEHSPFPVPPVPEPLSFKHIPAFVGHRTEPAAFPEAEPATVPTCTLDDQQAESVGKPVSVGADVGLARGHAHCAAV